MWFLPDNLILIDVNLVNNVLATVILTVQVPVTKSRYSFILSTAVKSTLKIILN